MVLGFAVDVFGVSSVRVAGPRVRSPQPPKLSKNR